MHNGLLLFFSCENVKHADPCMVKTWLLRVDHLIIHDRRVSTHENRGRGPKARKLAGIAVETPRPFVSHLSPSGALFANWSLKSDACRSDH